MASWLIGALFPQGIAPIKAVRFCKALLMKIIRRPLAHVAMITADDQRQAAIRTIDKLLNTLLVNMPCVANMARLETRPVADIDDLRLSRPDKDIGLFNIDTRKTHACGPR